MCFPGRPARPPPTGKHNTTLVLPHGITSLPPAPCPGERGNRHVVNQRGSRKGVGVLIIGSSPALVPLELIGTQNWGASAKTGTHNEGPGSPLNPTAKSVRPPSDTRANIPLLLQSYQNRSHLVHKDIHRGVERDPCAGGHGQEAEPHAHVEPLTDAGTVQQLRLLRRAGRVLRRLLRRLSAATWRLGRRSAGGPRN